jgi:pimeloyl-ACP methyl ester carboxylesterase/uncharacterized membrane protein HdeD (DUF308 family)
MGISDMGEQGSPFDPGTGVSPAASDTAPSLGTRPTGRLPSIRVMVGHFLSATRVAQVWGAHGLVGVIVGLILLSQFGAALGPIRAILGMWVLLTAGATVWRWHLDGRRSLSLLIVSVIGLVAGVLLLVGGGLSLLVIMWTVGFFWVAAGLLELLAWFQRPGPAVQWPWISGLILFFGVVMITFPNPLVPILTILGIVGAIVLGIVHLLRCLLLSRHAGHLATSSHRPSLLRRILLVLLMTILLAVPVLGYGKVLVTSATENARQGSLDAFYQVPSNPAPGAPGSIVRIEPLSLPGVDGRGWRILFRSQDQNGLMTISSGVVYAPASPGSDRLVVAWSHGTVGLAPNCAPSRQVVDSAITPWLNQMLAHNWVVTAPDYVGAGGTGGLGATEKYLIGAEQGRDLLNGVRAARNIPEAGAGTRFAIYGHSQGGLVALFGAALAPNYTPELTLVAVGAVSAASDIGGILRQDWNSPFVGWLFGPILVYLWTRYYPTLDANAILSPAGLNHYQEMAKTNCITDIPPAVINPLMGDFFSKDPATNTAWRQAFVANQAPLVPAGVPAFIGHGLADTLINPAFSAWLVTRYCANSTDVVTNWLPGVGHGNAAIQAAPQYIQWLATISGGHQPVSDCGKPLPVTPVQPLTV